MRKLLRVEIVINPEYLSERLQILLKADDPDFVYHVINTGQYDEMVITSVENVE